MKYPNIITVNSVIKNANTCQAKINDKYVPARPLGFMSFTYRIKATWLCFTGKADALLWEEQ